MNRILVSACILALSLTVSALDARAATLAEVKEGKGLHVCANPEALPFSSQDSARPGFQLELAEVIARSLGVKTEVSWVFDRKAARVAGCEVFMSAIVTPVVKGPIRLTKPYSGSGYVLVVPRSMNGVKTFEDLKGQKIAVHVESVAQWVLTKRSLTTTPTVTDEETVEQVMSGEAAAGAVPALYAGWYVKEHPDAPIKIADGYALEPELRWNVAVGLRNADQALVDAVSQILGDLQRDGTIRAMFAKYGIPYYEPFPTP